MRLQCDSVAGSTGHHMCSKAHRGLTGLCIGASVRKSLLQGTKLRMSTQDHVSIPAPRRAQKCRTSVKVFWKPETDLRD